MSISIHCHSRKNYQFGFKIHYQIDEPHLSNDVLYEIFHRNEFIAKKNPNLCNKFLKKEIQEWIFKNNLDKFEKRNPPSFTVKLIENKIILGEKIQ